MGLVEFQAVVMAAGRGSRLPELTGDRPKCLLPIGPFPLIWYPLHMLQKHGFQGKLLVESMMITELNNCPIYSCRGHNCCVGTSKVRNSTGTGKITAQTEAGLCMRTVGIGFGHGRIIETHL